MSSWRRRSLRDRMSSGSSSGGQGNNDDESPLNRGPASAATPSRRCGFWAHWGILDCDLVHNLRRSVRLLIGTRKGQHCFAHLHLPGTVLLFWLLLILLTDGKCSGEAAWASCDHVGNSLSSASARYRRSLSGTFTSSPSSRLSSSADHGSTHFERANTFHSSLQSSSPDAGSSGGATPTRQGSSSRRGNTRSHMDSPLSMPQTARERGASTSSSANQRANRAAVSTPQIGQHDFQWHYFYKPTFCGVCSRMMWSFPKSVCACAVSVCVCVFVYVQSGS